MWGTNQWEQSQSFGKKLSFVDVIYKIEEQYVHIYFEYIFSCR